MPAKKSVKLPIVAGKCSQQSPARFAARRSAERHQLVEARAGGGFRRGRCCPGEQPGLVRSAQVEDHVADRDAAARLRARRGAARRAEHPERKVLQRKLRVPVGRGHPALACAIMGLVDHAEPSLLSRNSGASGIEPLRGRRSANKPKPKASAMKPPTTPIMLTAIW